MTNYESLHPLLEVNNINIIYESAVIHDFSIELHQGEIISIIGRSGAGKSTILKALFGLVPIQAGRVLFNDREITHIHPKNAYRAGIAFIPASRNLFPKMTVLENLEVGLFGHGKNIVFKERLDYILSYFPLMQTTLKRQAASLTGSEQRLLEIARALLWRPSLLLIDNPSLNLSAQMRAQVIDAIQRLNSETGLAVLMTEQRSQLGISISHRTYLLERGHIIYEGTRSELLKNRSLIKGILGE